jgi:hypothetical protein
VVHISIKIKKSRVLSRWAVSHMDGLSIILLYYCKHANGSSINVNISFISIKPSPFYSASINNQKIFICWLATPVNEAKPVFSVESVIEVIDISIRLDDFANCKII